MARAPKRVELNDDAAWDHGGTHKFRYGIDRTTRTEKYEDFIEPSSTTLPAWLVVTDVSAAGAPTSDYVDDADAGEYQLLLAADVELESLTLSSGDQLTLDVLKSPVVEWRFKVDMDSAPWSADQRIVVGIASARDATLDDIVTHAWVKIDGASLNILIETDDGVTDTNDTDTGLDLVDDTYITVRVDLSDLTTPLFSILQNGTWNHIAGGDMSAATGNLQVYLEVQKDTGAETPDVRVDYVKQIVDR